MYIFLYFQNQSRPRVVKRGMDEFDIDEGEPADVDHILFMVHGIGSVCDFKFKPVEETGKWNITTITWHITVFIYGKKAFEIISRYLR